MREHLFRGFHPNKNGTTAITLNGKNIKGWWAEGDLVTDYCTGQKFIHPYGDSVNESDKVNEEGCLKFFSFEVLPETICEFTGFKDKFGKKIFEDDIVKVVTPRQHAVGIVKVGIGEIDGEGYKFIGVYGEIDGKRGEMVARSDENYEVIGNIYDNPELLTQG